MKKYLFSAPNGIDLNILNQANLSSVDKDFAQKTWQDVYCYRRETAFALKSASEIIDEFQILRTYLAPELVRMTIDTLLNE